MKRIDTPDGPRWYELSDGVRLPSVTTILRAVARPALVDWAAERERELVVEAAASLYEDLPAKRMPRAAFTASLYGRLPRTMAHVGIARAAASSGSQAHRMIEWALRGGVGRPPAADEQAIFAIGAYETWAAGHTVRPILIEQQIWSREWGYAGSMDLLAEVDGVLTVQDWKSGRAVYPESRLQIAAYAHALVEMGQAEWPLAGRIVCLPRGPEMPETTEMCLTPDEMTEAFRVFLNVLELWKWMQPAVPEAPVALQERVATEPTRFEMVF